MQAFFVLLLVVILGFILQFPAQGEPKAPEPRVDPPVKSARKAQQVQPMTREEIAARLKKFDAFAGSASKDVISLGAMCYKPMAPRDAPMDYICPVCNTKTSYPQRQIDDIDDLRRLVKGLPGLSATLDETFYCGKCNAKKEIQGLILEIRFPGADQPVKSKVTGQDITNLSKFLSTSEYKEELFEGSVVPETAKRIHEMLGIPQP